jgi:hypothetical protein
MPKLALFTSNTFYQDEGGLKIMTMVGENVTKQCFQPVKVDGSRDQTSKIVAAEIDMFKKILSELIDQESWKTSPLLKDHFIKDFNEKGKRPSIGILSFTTDQNIAIKTFLEDVPAEKRNEYNIFAGTTEEFQGNERNIMFILPALDSTLVSTSFYNNPLRFNVATSRAINFTYLIYGGIPNNFTKFQSYLRHFNVAGVDTADRLTFMDKYYSWKFDESKLESEFEERVYPFLIDVLQSNYPSKRMAIFNQAESCGKRLDFVIFNIETSKAFAIEVDGHTHFEEDSLSYTEDHIEREALLKRAGWDILHIPYYRWYNHGWLSDKNYPLFLKFTETLRQDLKRKIDNIMN